MTRPRTQTEQTLRLLRLLARGATLSEMASDLELSRRRIESRLVDVEQAGVALIRPEGKRGDPPGVYRLRDPRQVLGWPEHDPEARDERGRFTSGT